MSMKSHLGDPPNRPVSRNNPQHTEMASALTRMRLGEPETTTNTTVTVSPDRVAEAQPSIPATQNLAHIQDEYQKPRIQSDEKALISAVRRNRLEGVVTKDIESSFKRERVALVETWKQLIGGRTDDPEDPNYYTVLPTNFDRFHNPADKLSDLLDSYNFGKPRYEGWILVDAPPEEGMVGRVTYYFAKTTHDDDSLPNRFRTGNIVLLHNVRSPNGSKMTAPIVGIISDTLDSEEGRRITIKVYASSWEGLKHLVPAVARPRIVLRTTPAPQNRTLARRNLFSVVSKDLLAAYRGEKFLEAFEEAKDEDPRQEFKEMNAILRNVAHQLCAQKTPPSVLGMEMKPSQVEALLTALWTQVSIIHGAPGSGKSTTIVALAHWFRQAFQETKFEDTKILVICPSKKGVLALAKRLRAAIPETVVVVSELMKDELQSGRDEDVLTLRQQAIKCMEERAASNDEDAKDWQEAVYLQSRHDAGFILTDDDSDTRGARLAEAEDHVLEYQHVIVTTPASALCGRLKDFQFCAVIVDEASRMTDFDISCLAGKGLDRLVLCGDDRQLGINTVASRSRPYNSPLDAALNERLHFDRSAFYRLRKETWRMSARLFSFTNTSYGNLIVSQVPAGQPSSVFERTKESPVHFIQITTQTNTKRASTDTSPSSAEESKYATRIAACLVHGSKVSAENVLLFTPYQGQRRSMICRKRDTPLDISRVEVSTIDAYQGLEADHVILSLGTTNLKSSFLTDERINVGTSRQRKELYVITDWTLVTALRNDDNPMKRLYNHFTKEFGERVWLTTDEIDQEYQRIYKNKADVFQFVRCDHLPYLPAEEDFIHFVLDRISFIPPGKQGIHTTYDGLLNNEPVKWLHVSSSWIREVFRERLTEGKPSRQVRQGWTDADGVEHQPYSLYAASSKVATKNVRAAAFIAEAAKYSNDLLKCELKCGQIVVNKRTTVDSADWRVLRSIRIEQDEKTRDTIEKIWPENHQELFAQLGLRLPTFDDPPQQVFDMCVENRAWTLDDKTAGLGWLNDRDEADAPE